MDVDDTIEMEVEALDEQELVDDDLVEYIEEEDYEEEEDDGTIEYHEDDEYIEENYDDVDEVVIQQPIKTAITNLEKKSSITIKRVESPQIVPQPTQIIKRYENGKMVVVQQNQPAPRILNACAPSTITTPTLKSTPTGYTIIKKPDGTFARVAKTTTTTPQMIKTVISPSADEKPMVRKIIVKQTPPVGRVVKPTNIATTKTVFQPGNKLKPGLSAQKIVMSQSQLKAGQASGEIQEVNIPGKGIQYVRLLKKETPTKTTIKTPVKSSIPSPLKKLSIPLSKQLEGLGGTAKIVAVVKKEGGTTDVDTAKINSLTTSQLNQLTGATVIPAANNTKIVMLPSDYVEQLKAIQSRKSAGTTGQSKYSSEIDAEMERLKHGVEGDGYKKRACNCTKSQCLKLYCDCFANGEFCYNCNCKDCFNNLENEDERQKAIRATLERNPSAFKPKIGATLTDENDMTRKHTKGCNCKRSGCLKNYCECYEAKIPCGANCKCVGCRNTEENSLNYSMNDSMGRMVSLHSKKMADESLPPFPLSKQPYNFMTPDVIEATVQCMIAQADECQKRGCSIRTAERMILEEFGRCLVEIIDFSSKNES